MAGVTLAGHWATHEHHVPDMRLPRLPLGLLKPTRHDDAAGLLQKTTSTSFCLTKAIVFGGI